MELISLVLLPAALIWGGITVTRVSVITMASLFFLATACCPAEFFSIQAAGLSWTIDRIIILTLLGTFVVGWKTGRLNVLPLEFIDCLMGLFLIWLTARTITQPLGSIHPQQPHTLMHLINGYGVPFALYFVVRSSKLDLAGLRWGFWIMTLMGAYLSCTAVFEVAKLWSLVFPKFIADPALGIHFGRARGPMLQSVRLGICLLACLLISLIYTVWLNPNYKSRWLLSLITVPILLLAIVLTYTRSIWMGAIAVMVLLVLLCFDGVVRRRLVMGGAVVGILGALIAGPNLIAFKREYSAAETRESTYMRAAFAYVSLEMIKQRPIAGFGFNQFNVANLEFLSDRSTDIRLESIRGYVHHNSFLSLLVDLGMVGFSLFFLLIAACVRQSWHVWKSTDVPKWVRGLGLVGIGITSVHVIQMAFHEVSYSSMENGLLFGWYGLVLAAKRQFSIPVSTKFLDQN